MIEISTSILSMENGKESETIFALEEAKTDYFHIDVMDGKFVENDTNIKMQEFTSYIKGISNLPIDVHLMVEDVKYYIESYSVFNPNIITFHLEACNDEQEVYEMIKLIKENNCKVGIAIKPNTEIEEIYKFLPYIHMCLVMTVEPGKGGQALLPNTIIKLKKLKEYIQENDIDIDIEADGGINLETYEKVKSAGTDILVAGSAILGSDNYKSIITKFKSNN